MRASSDELAHYARLIEGFEESTGQLSLWRLYSFRDLPVELISNIYQLFVKDASSSIYTPPALVRLMLEETLSWDRLDTLMAGDGVILDPACGSGVFLVEAYRRRSEEHTSELQSLMRISSAVFCLKKKTNHKTDII